MKILHPDSPWVGEDEVADDEIVVATTRGELALLANSIGEALEAVEDWEFDTRLGVTPERARAIRDSIGDVLRVAVLPE